MNATARWEYECRVEKHILERYVMTNLPIIINQMDAQRFAVSAATLEEIFEKRAVDGCKHNISSVGQTAWNTYEALVKCIVLASCLQILMFLEQELLLDPRSLMTCGACSIIP